MQAVILCGGRGTRICSKTGDRIPKILVPVLGHPFIDWQIELLLEQEVTEFLYVTGHLGSQIQAHVEYHWRDLDTTFFDGGTDGKWHAYLRAGNAGLLKFKHAVVYGDVYVPLLPIELWGAHRWEGFPFVFSEYDDASPDAGVRLASWPRRHFGTTHAPRPHYEVGSPEGLARLEAHLR